MCVKFSLIITVVVGLGTTIQAQDKAKVVLISGSPSHGRMQHEHRAGNIILADALNKSGMAVETIVVPDYPGCAALPRPWAMESNAVGVLDVVSSNAIDVVSKQMGRTSLFRSRSVLVS